MKQTKKWLEPLAFLLVAALIFAAANSVFIPQDDARQEKAAFYDQPEDSLDVIYIGSSTILRGISPLEIWQDYGISSYSMATFLQAPMITLTYLKDIFKTQQPQVVVIGCERIFSDYDYGEMQPNLRYALDRMPNSLNKMEAIRTIVAQDDSQSFFSYLFPVLRYHSRWSEIETYTLDANVQSPQMGYLGLGQSEAFDLPEEHLAVSGTEPTLSEESLEYYRQAIALCQQQGSQVLMVKPPRMTWTAEEAQAQQDFADEMGVPLLDFNLPQYWAAVGLDAASDFYDPGHLSTTGASKLSHFLGTYLQENYHLTDHRGESAFSAWDENLEDYQQKFAFCLHMAQKDGQGVYTMEISQRYLQDRQLSADAFTYDWTFYLDGKQIAQEMGTQSNQFAAALTYSGQYTAVCTVYQEGNAVYTMESLGIQWEEPAEANMEADAAELDGN